MIKCVINKIGKFFRAFNRNVQQDRLEAQKDILIKLVNMQCDLGAGTPLGWHYAHGRKWAIIKFENDDHFTLCSPCQFALPARITRLLMLENIFDGNPVYSNDSGAYYWPLKSLPNF